MIQALCAALQHRIEGKIPQEILPADPRLEAVTKALLDVREIVNEETRAACETVLTHLSGEKKPPVTLDTSLGARGMFAMLLERPPADVPVDTLILSLLEAKTSTVSNGRSKSKAQLAEELSIERSEVSSLIAQAEALISENGYMVKTVYGLADDKEGNRYYLAKDTTGQKRNRY